MKKQWLTLHTSTKTYKLNKPIWQFSFNNNFDFGKGWLLSMESYYIKRGDDEIGAIARNSGSVDISLTKSFLRIDSHFELVEQTYFIPEKEEE